MITPPINDRGDRLLLQDDAVAQLRPLMDARAAAAREATRNAVLHRLENIKRHGSVIHGEAQFAFERDQLVDVILELVQTAVLTDRSRQRDVLREVQANLPAWAALGQASVAE